MIAQYSKFTFIKKKSYALLLGLIPIELDPPPPEIAGGFALTYE